MTTKFRIIVSFAVVIILLGVMAVLGYGSLQKSSNNFNNYQRLANVNVSSSDMRSDMYAVSYYTSQYILYKNPDSILAARARVDNALRFSKQMLERAKLESSINSIHNTQKLLQEIDVALTTLQKDMELVQSIFQKESLPNMIRFDEIILSLGEGALAHNDLQSMYYQTLIWNKIAVVREAMVKFLDNMDIEEGEAILVSLDECRKFMEKAGESMVLVAQGQRDYANMTSAFDKVVQSIKPMIAASRAARASMDAINTKGFEIQNIVDQLSSVSDSLMRQEGTVALESNKNGQSQLLIISVVGLLLGVAFSAYTIISLVRVLKGMSLFATDIADGNFASTSNIREKGEIGAMFQAICRIPEIFREVITRCNDVSGDITTGMFRDRLELAELSGGFRELAASINTIADAYTGVIDNLPVGILTIGPDNKARFRNNEGDKMVGEDTLRAFGGSMPLLDASLRSNKRVSEELILKTPEGGSINVNAIVLPLRNAEGKPTAGLQVLTDITEIKEKQQLMLGVAEEASAISDRVAAAAEELATQVEQISRGADVQRSRMESTASAMTQMNSTVMEVARNAGQASEQSGNTRERAENGAQLVNQVVEAIMLVNAVGKKLQDNMQELGEKAENIGGVMNIISDIADQTNLLALNAAIEAARAGEAGRGFAVVADEVRKLAEKTMAATQEVGTNIGSIQQAARVNIEEVGHAVTNVGKATELANASGSALVEIVALATSNSDVVASIATAAEEQSATSEEINSSVDEIARITSETADGMIQSSSAVQELSHMAQDLRRVMQRLK